MIKIVLVIYYYVILSGFDKVLNSNINVKDINIIIV